MSKKKTMSEKDDAWLGTFAIDLARDWYNEGYGGYHWKTADEIVEEFILWLYKNGGEIKYESKITNS